ncbi:MAG: glutamine amidotransferase [Gammaproteobacteria bacterium]|nr:glutamine amidotransferase [Gammaproteobacteria bacterium]
MPDKTILLVDHHDNPRDDLATIYLQEAGFQLELCCPFKGDPLPDANAGFIGAVIYGGEPNVTELDQFPYLKDELKWIGNALADDLPMVGICLGGQLIAHVLGAHVGYHDKGLCEFGYYPIKPTVHGLSVIPRPMHVVEAHKQYFDLPEDAVLLAEGEIFENQAFRYGNHVYALQFHPEISADIFRRWQDSDWAFYGHPGAQIRAEQDQLLPSAASIQSQWFKGFLQHVFGDNDSMPDRYNCLDK